MERIKTMMVTRISRAAVAVAAIAFAVLALAIWAAPASMAARMGLGMEGARGATAVRAELGGLFAGLAALCGAAAWTLGRAWLVAAVCVLGGIALGRAIGWLSSGVSGDGAAMAIEMSLIVALAWLARDGTCPASGASPHRVRAVGVAAGTLLLTAAGLTASMNTGIQQRFFDRAAEARAATINTAPLEDDALRVAVCGSSAPLPSAARAKACVAVFAGGRFWVVDAGPESVENLVLWGVPLSSIGGVLLTHFHSDHIGDLGELNLQTWAAGRPGPLAVYGGPGVSQIVDGMNGAYRLDQGYRTAHHSATVMPPETWPMEARAVSLEESPAPVGHRSAVVLDEAGLRITAFEADHAPIAPAYAYRFDYKGRSAFVTGDLTFHPQLAQAADGVDVLVSEAIAVNMTRALGRGAGVAGRSRTATIMHDIEDYHITPEQAAEVANAARVRLLVFYHLLPAPDGALARSVFARGVDQVRKGGWVIADDGSLYTLPLGSTEVRVGRIEE